MQDTSLAIIATMGEVNHQYGGSYSTISQFCASLILIVSFFFLNVGLVAINSFHNSIIYPSCNMVIIQNKIVQLPVPFNSIASVSIGTAKNNRHYGGS
jgi:hypothetical protein